MEKTLLLTPRDAARQLRIGRSAVYLLLKTGQLASIKIGRSRRIPFDSLVRLTKKLQEENQPGAWGG